MLPPANLNNLRVLHASCRKPHGGGADALPVGNAIVAAALGGSDHRPQQLFLGGDQIYADDVAVSLLYMLQDAAEALGLREEQLPVKGGAKKGKDLKPAGREDVLGDDDAGFTSGERASHLMTFADFALMYVFAWSDVLWPSSRDIPGFAEARSDLWASVRPTWARSSRTDASIAACDTTRSPARSWRRWRSSCASARVSWTCAVCWPTSRR